MNNNCISFDSIQHIERMNKFKKKNKLKHEDGKFQSIDLKVKCDQNL